MITKLKTSPVSLPLVVTDNEEDFGDRDDVQALDDEDEPEFLLGLLEQGFTRSGSNFTGFLHKDLYFQRYQRR